jgi:hypothetical protein
MILLSEYEGTATALFRGEIIATTSFVFCTERQRIG